MLADFPALLQNLVEDMRLRMQRSVFKITKAVATANASQVATKDHAEYALRFVQDKVNFLRSIELDDVPDEKPSIDDTEKRRGFIEKEFRGKRFRIDDVQKLLAGKMEGECDKRTIQRDLKALEARSLQKPKGTWSLR